MNLLLKNCRLAFADFVAPGALLIEEGHIARIWLDEQPAGARAREIDCGGLLVAAGLIDIHNHGALTHDFVAADGSGNNAALRFHAEHGVTTMLPTVMTETHEQMCAALRMLAEQSEAGELCPNFRGIHVEGPYFNEEKRGAHRLEYLRDPSPAEYEQFWQEADGLIRIFTFAPERKGSIELCEFLNARECVPAIGHTRATLDQIRRAAASGARHFVHANNAIDWPTRRMRSDGWLGTELMGMGALLSHTAFTGEIISDGYHVPLEMIRIILAARGPESIAMVSDSSSAVGCRPGEYALGGMKIRMREAGLVTCAEPNADGTVPLAGSGTPLIQMVQNYVKWGFGLLTPLRMATIVPARIIGETLKGKLQVGADADLIVIDETADLHATIIMGEVIHARDESWRG